MAEAKTQPTSVRVEEFLATVADPRRRAEAEAIHELMKSVTGDKGTMWGPSMVGYGIYSYTYASGRTGDWPKVGFSPRKAQFTFYGLKDDPAGNELLAELGPHTVGAGCVYVKKVDQLDQATLRKLIAIGFARGDYDATA